eukprot:CAMPEP_0174835246 /NCGR_PEP_ID=MMETSP1114-20130205/5309_1 /TAXON_ID=312471 /ORGANISM="Neobodo designis, Strain CCAP 1951/1" /LENGTH=314 /DNA_ID=CAMNT_0016069191 /DNA_START=25 /DNA_END=969 /DNA_ORIENTATION=-
MESQGDSLMRRKMELQGAVSLPPNESEPPSQSNLVSHSVQKQPVSGSTSKELPPISPRSFRGGATQPLTTVPPYRRHLEEREKELQDFVQLQMVAALDDLRRDEALRAEACRRQRDVERMKLRQRMKQRLELQAAAKQPVPSEIQEAMGVDHPQDAHLTATAQHRRELRDVPTRTYLEHNADRLVNAMLHREACREAERVKAQMRVAMEEYVGTDFAKRRKQLWAANGGQPSASVRCPTASEQRRCRSRQRRETEMQAEEQAEVRRALEEVSALDDAVWSAEAAKRANKSASRMAKDVPFDVNADFHRRPTESK